MCGIFGYSIKPSAVSDTRRGMLALNLARLNDDRGGHSWGLAAVAGDEITIERGLGDLYPNAYRLAEHHTFYAHTRFGTTGAKTVENAHPFEIGDIIGAHNGMLWNHKELDALYGRSFAVDSQHLFAHLADDLAFDDIEGYGAIEWIDRRASERIYLSRLAGGELSVYGIGTSPSDVQGIVWTSDEMHMLETLEACGIRAFEYNVEIGHVYFVQDFKLYTKKDMTLNLAIDTRHSLSTLEKALEMTSGKARDRKDPSLLWDEADPWEEYQRLAGSDTIASDDAPEDDADAMDEDAFLQWARSRSAMR